MAQKQLPLEEMTFRQLRKVASEYNLFRYSRMRKAQLLAAIEQVIQKQTVQQLKIKETIINPTFVQEEEEMEASKFEVDQDEVDQDEVDQDEVDQDAIVGEPSFSVDDELGELPDGYGESRIFILPRDPQWSYAYWDVPNSAKEELRRQGGQQLALRLYDVTDIDLNHQSSHSVQEYLCDELAREWYLPIPVSDRHYVLDIGYRCFDGRWLVLARSASVHIPPVYSSDWIEDIFVTVDSKQELQGKMIYNLISPTHHQAIFDKSPIYEETLGMDQEVKAQRVAGSVFGSMQHITGSVVSSYVHQKVVSSYVFPSGVGMWAISSTSSVNVSGLTMSDVGLGITASAPPKRPHSFWLVADAELIVYGATEPDATVTIGGRPIELNPDGTFRFQMSFQDGLIDYPIVAVAVDGKQTRSIQMKFNRETPKCHNNTKEEEVLE